MHHLLLPAPRLASILLLAVTVALPCGALVAAENGEEEPLELELVKVTGYRIKRAEYEEFLQVISPWEREHLLLNV